ncbi:hypothetical protein DVH05_001190 [Phytophthora capsici]|nr:hypothetical protein DVH05_001190 [Phytophthora capsici]
MGQCIKSLIAFDQRKGKEYQYRVSLIGQFANSNYDEEMGNVLRFKTHYVPGQIEHQYTAAMDNASKYQYDLDKDNGFVVIVLDLFSEHKLRLDCRICDCEFATSMCISGTVWTTWIIRDYYTKRWEFVYDGSIYR